MGLGTDLATATTLKGSLQTHGAPTAIVADATTLVGDLSAQVTSLQGDLAGYQALVTSLTNDGANSTVMTDANKIVADLISFLS